jgi:hypothetical protein
MAIYLVIDKASLKILNVIEWDGVTPYAPPQSDAAQLLAYPDGASPGWLWDGARAVDPNPPAALDVAPQAQPGGMAIT